MRGKIISLAWRKLDSLRTTDKEGERYDYSINRQQPVCQTKKFLELAEDLNIKQVYHMKAVKNQNNLQALQDLYIRYLLEYIRDLQYDIVKHLHSIKENSLLGTGFDLVLM